jgi:hypothetical protein
MQKKKLNEFQRDNNEILDSEITISNVISILKNHKAEISPERIVENINISTYVGIRSLFKFTWFNPDKIRIIAFYLSDNFNKFKIFKPNRFEAINLKNYIIKIISNYNRLLSEKLEQLTLF